MGKLLTTFKDKTFEPSMKSFYQLYTDDSSTASQIYDSLLYVRGVNAGSLVKNQENDDANVSTVENYDTYMPVRFYNVKSTSDGGTPASATHTFFSVYNRAEYNGGDGKNMYDLWADRNLAKLSGAGYITNTIGGAYNYGLDAGSGDSQTIPGVYGAVNLASAVPTGDNRTVSYLIGSRDWAYLIGSRDWAYLNKANATATYVYPTISEFAQVSGTVGTLAMLKLDIDYTAGDMTNAYYIWADESTLPTPSGEKYFIKSNIPWPTLLSGTLTNTGAVTFNSTLSVTGTATFNSDVSLQDNDILKIGTGNDLQIYHNASNSYIEQSSSATGDLIIRNRLASRDVIFQGDNGDGDGSQTTYFQLDNSMANTGNPDVYTRFPDNSRLTFGNSANANSLDLEIYHDGSDSHIINKGGDFNIESNSGIYITNDTADDITIEQKRNDGDIIFKSDDGSGGTTEYLKLDGGDTRIKIPDNIITTFGNGGDLQLSHDATDSLIRNYTGDLYIQNNSDDKDIIFQTDNGAGSTITYFHCDGSLASSGFTTTKWPDQMQIALGDDRDLRLWHQSSNNYIAAYTGDLYIKNETDDGDVIFQSDNGSGGLSNYIVLDGGDVSTKIETIKVLMPNLPTSDPSVAGQLWNSSGDLKISAG